MPTKYKLEAQAMEELVIVKRAVKGRIRMELRIREVDKGGATKVTNTREAGPSANSRAGFNCTVSDLVELTVINCSGTG